MDLVGDLRYIVVWRLTIHPAAVVLDSPRLHEGRALGNSRGGSDYTDGASCLSEPDDFLTMRERKGGRRAVGITRKKQGAFCCRVVVFHLRNWLRGLLPPSFLLKTKKYEN